MEDKLLKLNEFTRREHTLEEVYMFDVILCGNDIDRDIECFSDEALEVMAKLFIGKTGIFDHNITSQNQTARIFDTEVVTTVKKTLTGATYKYVKASAYMIRTESNSDLIKEIEGGIKKEVSVSVCAGKKICSVCGTDKKKKSCVHVKGTEYGKKNCYVILDDIKDVYEWSFVAVPAQAQAGVVKKLTFEDSDEKFSLYDSAEIVEKEYLEKITKLNEKIEQQKTWLALFEDELKKDILKYCVVADSPYTKFVETTLDKLSFEELCRTKKELQQNAKINVKSQLFDVNLYKTGD